MHAVVAREAPTARLIDVTHMIERHDVRAGAMTLWRAAPWLVPGVILAVVDPGVGTTRRAVALEVAGTDAVLVGPDNGLLLPAAAHLGGVTAAVELPPNLSAAGVTFAGRDVFAPAAARAANGVAVASLGTPFDPATLQGVPVPQPVLERDRRLRAEIIWIDHFGNAQLNVAASAVQPLGAVAGVVVGGRHIGVEVVSSYGAIRDEHFALVVDSYGMLALSANRRSAADHLGLAVGEPVWLLCRNEAVTVA